MPRYFLSKEIFSLLTEKKITELMQTFKLSDQDINLMKHWNDAYSPHGGVIINTEKDAQYKCYPYDKGAHNFDEEYGSCGDGIENIVITMVITKNLKKVKLAIHSPLQLIPIDDMPNYPKITQTKKLGFWVYEDTIKHGASDGIGDEIIVRELSVDDVSHITKNNGECFVEVDSSGMLSLPSNGYGYKKVIIYLENPFSMNAQSKLIIH